VSRTLPRHKLCDLDSLANNQILRIDDVPDVAGVTGPLAVVRTDGQVYCIDDTCSHQTASLSDGWVENGCIECPMHESRFDLRTGRPDVPPARDPIRSHLVEVIDGEVFLVGGDR